MNVVLGVAVILIGFGNILIGYQLWRHRNKEHNLAWLRRERFAGVTPPHVGYKEQEQG